jgi:hypothetical protein
MSRADLLNRLKEANLTLPAAMNRTSAVNIGRQLGVDGVFYGSVLEFIYLNEIRNGRVVGKEPAVGLQAKLVDVRRSALLWSASHSRSSYEMLVTTRNSIARVTEIAISKMTEGLKNKSIKKK